MEETMSSDSESSFVGLVYQQRHTALAASFLSCPPYCENDCGTNVVFWPRDSNTIFEGKNARI